MVITSKKEKKKKGEKKQELSEIPGASRIHSEKIVTSEVGEVARDGLVGDQVPRASASGVDSFSGEGRR